MSRERLPGPKTPTKSAISAPNPSPWTDGFLFIGNHPALDFLNTRPVLDDGPTELLADFATLLRWFEAAGLLGSQQARLLLKDWSSSFEARQAVEHLRSFREKLRQAVISWEQTGKVSADIVTTLNRIMTSSPMLTRLATPQPRSRNQKPEHLAIERWFDPQRPSDLIAPIAYFAAQLFAEEDSRRVRQCGQCVLHFLDTSKKGTRRWCSMQLCGNRQKVAAYAQRQRDQQG